MLAATLRGLLDEGEFLSVTDMDDEPGRASRGGWAMARGTVDPVFGVDDLKKVYDAASGGDYVGRCTAPLLVDKATKAIVSNESADIVRAFLELRGVGNDADLRPPAARADVDDWNDWIYETVNNGVYRAGFATTQAAYERAESQVHGRATHGCFAGTSTSLRSDRYRVRRETRSPELRDLEER